MERVRLGTSDLEVTRLCLGTWNMDGSPGWGPQSDDESIELIRKVLDTGCCFIDTAHAYGGGHSEEVLGRALEGRRDDVIAATKIVQGDPARVESELDAALERLRTDYVDVYICHWRAAGLVLDDFMAELARLRKKGKARACGYGGRFRMTPACGGRRPGNFLLRAIHSALSGSSASSGTCPAAPCGT